MRVGPQALALAGSAAFALAVAACAPQAGLSSTATGTTRTPASALPPAGAPLPTGASIATMREQYAHPRKGPTAAAGASSWVTPAPLPAYVVSTPLPPGDPPAPPPAAVANRQPDPRPAPAATAMPAAPATPAAPVVSVDAAKSRQLFADYGCSGCHTLADAGASGGVGPSLDGNSRLTRDYVVGAISEGRGAMPAFRDQLTTDQIATLAAYIVQMSRK